MQAHASCSLETLSSIFSGAALRRVLSKIPSGNYRNANIRRNAFAVRSDGLGILYSAIVSCFMV